jgi:hypothetical protein
MVDIDQGSDDEGNNDQDSPTNKTNEYPESYGNSPYSRVPLAPRTLLQSYKIKVPAEVVDPRSRTEILLEWSASLKSLTPMTMTFDGTTDSFFSYVQVLQERRSVDFIWDAATYYIHYGKEEDEIERIDLLNDFITFDINTLEKQARTLWREETANNPNACITIRKSTAARRIFAQLILQSTTKEFRASINIPSGLDADGQACGNGPSQESIDTLSINKWYQCKAQLIVPHKRRRYSHYR